MRNITYIERDAFGRGNFVIDTTPNRMEQRDATPRLSLFLRRFPQMFQTLVGLFSRSRNSNIEDVDQTNDNQTNRINNNTDNVTTHRNSHDDDDVFWRNVAQPIHDAQSERDQHISRDVFGRGNTSFLDNAMIHDNNSMSFAQSLLIRRRRLDRSATNSTCGHSASLSPALSPIFSGSSAQSAENKYDGDKPVPVKSAADRKNTVESHQNEQVAKLVTTNSSAIKQNQVAQKQRRPDCLGEEERADTLQIETEEEYHSERDPEVDYTGQGQEIEREMSLGSSCDDEILTASFGVY